MRRFSLIAAAAVLCIAAIYMFLAYQGYRTLIQLKAIDLKTTPSGAFENVSFPSRQQNYKVYGWFMPGETGMPALISVHGYRGSRHDPYHIDRAVALRGLGYNVLTIDLQDNGGDTVEDGRLSMGFKEQKDVLGAFDYLLSRGFQANQIGLVSESMGAATSLMAAGQEPRIKAIWEDSGYTCVDTVLGEQAASRGFPPLIIPGGLVWGFVLGGDRMWEVTPISLGPVLAANKQAVYIIHDEPDQTVLFHHGVDLYNAYGVAGVDVTFWDMPDGDHAQAINNHHAEYLRRLDRFFKTHLTQPF